MPRDAAPRGPLAAAASATIGIFKKASPSVAVITTDIDRILSGKRIGDKLTLGV